MKQFPTKEERLKKKNELIAQATALYENVDPAAIKRMQERKFLGETENDNPLLLAADRIHAERLIESMELLVKASKYKDD